jgi:hypothetical protein
MISKLESKICPKTKSGPSGYSQKDPPELPTQYHIKGPRTRSGPPGYSNP